MPIGVGIQEAVVQTLASQGSRVGAHRILVGGSPEEAPLEVHPWEAHQRDEEEQDHLEASYPCLVPLAYHVQAQALKRKLICRPRLSQGGVLQH